MASNQPTEDLATDSGVLQTFDPSFWINNQQTYPQDDPPVFIAEARSKAFTIPGTLSQQLFPADGLLVPDFLKISFPNQSASPPFSKVALWFSKDPPSTDLAILLTRPIPFAGFLDQLRDAAGQMWFDGMQSIRDPRYHRGTERFPLAALQFWVEISRLNAAQHSWQDAVSWLSSPTLELGEMAEGIGEVVIQAQKILHELPWNASSNLYGVATTTVDISRFLGTQWLSDTCLDIIIGYLNDRLKQNPQNMKNTMIASLPIMHEILRGHATKNFSNARGLLRIMKRVINAPEGDCLQHLYLPAFIHGAHWAVIHVDFEKLCIEYGEWLLVIILISDTDIPSTGDSLTFSQPPKTELQALTAWLNSWSSARFADKGNTLAHGIQGDTNSCGIFAANTIMHAVFQNDLLTAGDVAFQRIRWFTAFADQILNKVCSKSFTVAYRLIQYRTA